MTSAELPLDEGWPVAGRLCTAPITAQFGTRVAHEVTDEAVAAARGEYEALCGCVFVAAPLAAPAGRPCPACLGVIAAARHATGLVARNGRTGPARSSRPRHRRPRCAPPQGHEPLTRD